MKKSVFLSAALLAFLCAASGQQASRLAFTVRPQFLVPIGSGADLFGIGGGSSLEAGYKLSDELKLCAIADYSLATSEAESSLSLLSGGAGLAYGIGLADRLGVAIYGSGGAYAAFWNGDGGWSYYGKGGGEITARLGPALSISVGASYAHYIGPSGPFLQEVGATIAVTLNTSGFAGESVRVRNMKLDPIFPVFYTFYDKNAFGSINVKNEEDATIRDVSVYFIIKQYMNEPKLCGTYSSIPKGRSVTVPIFALLKDDVLKLTENSKAGAETIVDYTILGKRREIRFSETVMLNHRNAMTWDDDRRAAAFVSAKDPAVLRYSKFAAGIIRESREGGEIDQNLKIAAGLFEGLKLYGLNYVVDPTTPYQELSENASAVDFLQYPYQTLVYKGGDCDDLSIMFAAILQSVGIGAAFITVPGHIYIGFELAAGESGAKRLFAHQDDLIYANGKAWIPVEITMINDGFLKAWLYGAREWRDADEGKRALYTVEEAWTRYEPVGIPGEDTRIVLPPAEGIETAFKAMISAVTDREISASADRIKTELGGQANETRLGNSLGILYARYGKLAEAKKEFERAAKSGSASALCNLGNLSFVEKNYKAASEYYERTLRSKPANTRALLGLARSRYELEQYDEAKKRFAELNEAAPKLAAAYAYIGSGGSAGRAAAANENLEKVPWDEE